MNEHERINRKIIDEASKWLSHLEDGHAIQNQAFLAWIARDKRHLRGVLQLAGLSTQLKGLAPAQWAAAGAAARSRGSHVIHLPPDSSSRLAWIAASFLAFVLAIQLALYAMTPDFRTAVGEHRLVQLSDGSSIHLNTSSRVRVKFSKVGRTVELIQGEALFTVAHEAERPFSVIAGSVEVRAVGTEFVMDRRPTKTLVSVLDGRVRVRYKEPWRRATNTVEMGAAKRAELRAEQAALTLSDVDSRDLQVRLAWTRGVIVFQGAPLSEAIAEFNRYNKTQIRLGVSSMRDATVGGTFAVTEVETFVSAVSNVFKLQATWSDSPQGRTVHLTTAE